MRNPRQGAIPSELGWLIDELDDHSQRLRVLEAPSGEALSNAVAKLRALVENIQEQLDTWVASRYTNAQIDDLIDQKVAAYVASYMTGNVQVGGAFRVLGDTQLDGAVRAPGVRSTDLTTTSDRVIVWQGGASDPRLGHT